MRFEDEAEEARGAPTRCQDLVFDGQFLSAVRSDGETLRFTRQERALLATLAARPGRLFNRDQLLAAIAGEDSLATDRQVDFVVNRLRRKLGDMARAPRFIATQYGEGYVWIAGAQPRARAPLMVIGPVRGLDLLASPEPVRRGLDKLHRRLLELGPSGADIRLDPDWRPRNGGRPDPRFVVRVDLHEEASSIHAALVLAGGGDGRTLRLVRRALPEGLVEGGLGGAADELIDGLWRGVITPAEVLEPGAAPLELRIEAAALAVSEARDTGWRFIMDQARLALERDPADAEAAIVLAACIFAQRIFDVDFDGSDERAWTVSGDEIERLVLGALSRGCQDPLLRLAAARLLFGIHRGHLALVQHFLSGAQASSAAFAAGLALAGLVAMYLGDLPGAVRAYDQALALCEARAEFEVYLQRRKAEALIAGGDREAALVSLDRALSVKPQEPLLHLLRLDPSRPADRATSNILAGLTPERARRLMGRLVFGQAANFSKPEQAASLLAGPVRHLVDRFGAEVLPQGAARGSALRSQGSA